MGINPNSGDGIERNYVVDGRHDAENLVSDAEHTGQEAGKAFAHIAAQADSANMASRELSARVKALEERQAVVKDSDGRIQATDPAAPDDVATKRYVDKSISGLDIPEPPAAARAVFTGTGNTAAAGWSTWDARTVGDFTTLEVRDTRMTVLEAGLYCAAYIGADSSITRQLLAETIERVDVSLAGGSFVEVLNLQAGDQLRVVGSQPDLTVIIDRLDP